MMDIRAYKAAIFDFDGTLIDSMNMWTEIDIEYLARYGHVFEPDLQEAIEGMSPEEMAVYFRNRYGIPRTNEEMISEWVEMSKYKYLHELRLKPHTEAFLSFLRENGLRIAAATSTDMDIIAPCLAAHGIRGYFDAIATTSECGKGKPAPDVYLLAAEKAGVKPEACVAFDDLPAGLRSASAAGMVTVAVDDTFSKDRETEKRKLSDLFISDFRELMV